MTISPTKLILVSLSWGLATLVTPGYSFAKGPHRADARIMQVIEKLNLSSDQLNDLRSLTKDLRSDIRAARNAERQLRSKFSDALNDASLEPAELQRLHEKLIEARSATMRARFALMNQVRAKLTLEQRQEFSRLRQEFTHHRRSQGKHPAGMFRHQGRRGPKNMDDNIPRIKDNNKELEQDDDSPQDAAGRP